MADLDTWAFPVSTIDGFTEHGMTLREWFAGQALANSAICTGDAPEWQLKAWFGERCGIKRAEVIARQSFDYADAMLAARTTTPEANS